MIQRRCSLPPFFEVLPATACRAVTLYNEGTLIAGQLSWEVEPKDGSLPIAIHVVFHPVACPDHRRNDVALCLCVCVRQHNVHHPL